MLGRRKINRENPFSWCPQLYFMAHAFDESLAFVSRHQQLIGELPDFFAKAALRCKAEFLAGRLCAAEAIKRALGRKIVPKTSADGAPLWPHELIGSISHKDGLALCVLTRKRHALGLGVDLANKIPLTQLLELAPLILQQKERARFFYHPNMRVRQFKLTAIFSLKESLFKALYPLVGKRFYFETAEVLHCSCKGVARIKLLCDLAPRFRTDTEIRGYVRFYQGKILTLVLIDSRFL